MVGGLAWGMELWSHLVVDSPTKTSTLGKLKNNTLSTTPARTKKIKHVVLLTIPTNQYTKENQMEGIHAPFSRNIICLAPPTILDFYPILLYTCCRILPKRNGPLESVNPLSNLF
jgi:hypothetical protein